MLYEKLNRDMQEMVDVWVAKLRGLSWRRRSDLLSDAALTFTEQFEPDDARQVSKGFITAVIERSGSGEVLDPHQACLFLLSLDPSHNALAERYLEEHPELRPAIEQNVEGWR